MEKKEEEEEDEPPEELSSGGRYSPRTKRRRWQRWRWRWRGGGGGGGGGGEGYRRNIVDLERSHFERLAASSRRSGPSISIAFPFLLRPLFLSLDLVVPFRERARNVVNNRIASRVSRLNEPEASLRNVTEENDNDNDNDTARLRPQQRDDNDDSFSTLSLLFVLFFQKSFLDIYKQVSSINNVERWGARTRANPLPLPLRKCEYEIKREREREREREGEDVFDDEKYVWRGWG